MKDLKFCCVCWAASEGRTERVGQPLMAFAWQRLVGLLCSSVPTTHITLCSGYMHPSYFLGEEGGGAGWTGVSLNFKACYEPRKQFWLFAYISLYSGPRWLSAFGEKDVHIVKGHYVSRGCTRRPLLSPWVRLPPSGERGDWTKPQLWGPLASEVFLWRELKAKRPRKCPLSWKLPFVFPVKLNCWEF